MSVTSVLRSCAVLASLKTRSLLRFNHHLRQLEPPVGPIAHEVGRPCRSEHNPALQQRKVVDLV